MSPLKTVASGLVAGLAAALVWFFIEWRRFDERFDAQEVSTEDRSV